MVGGGRLIPIWEERFGKPCPRVGLNSDNVDCAQLAIMLIDSVSFGEPYGSFTKTLIPPLHSAILQERGPIETRTVIMRLRSALQSEIMGGALEFHFEKIKADRELEELKRKGKVKFDG